MSSAIEVLKREKKYMKLHCGAISNGQWIPRDLRLAFDEALLALEKRENYVIDFIRLEVLPKSKKEQFRVFFKDGTEQVFENKKGW